jgi:hypothetical protein
MIPNRQFNLVLLILRSPQRRQERRVGNSCVWEVSSIAHAVFPVGIPFEEGGKHSTAKTMDFGDGCLGCGRGRHESVRPSDPMFQEVHFGKKINHRRSLPCFRDTRS